MKTSKLFVAILLAITLLVMLVVLPAWTHATESSMGPQDDMQKKRPSKPSPSQRPPRPQPSQRPPLPEPSQRPPRPSPSQRPPKPRPSSQRPPRPEPSQRSFKPQREATNMELESVALHEEEPHNDVEEEQPNQRPPKPSPSQRPPRPQPSQRPPRPEPSQRPPRPSPSQRPPRPTPSSEKPKKGKATEGEQPDQEESGSQQGKKKDQDMHRGSEKRPRFSMNLGLLIAGSFATLYCLAVGSVLGVAYCWFRRNKKRQETLLSNDQVANNHNNIQGAVQTDTHMRLQEEEDVEMQPPVMSLQQQAHIQPQYIQLCPSLIVPQQQPPMAINNDVRV
ncbi:hypothetical protein C9374_014486 [Naegleria lovaniensis]|uniref:Uncharacterized protein n=1 Tax=Naegleria lovaniensis TaxID=51637 RepID=A0AA88GVD0_NAELO|nr:uncharacterized protein C9374_014486 [Naegleria lovaniensis]KAG2389086.1 hypothetical protein C9374_014486 [Naegleria lovaniensis]